MFAMTVSELCAAVNGKLLSGDPAVQVESISTDSRTIGEGELFLPVAGENFDGHDYIEKALAAGAAGCLCSRVPEWFTDGKFYIQVENTRLALKALAQWYRKKFPSVPFVQVTGSVGKTTCKEMLASVLSEHFMTLKTQANFNSDLGVPQTVLRADESTQAAVIETGMDHFGEIRYLGEIVRPHIAVITNVGDAHIEFLGSREGILKAKSEIFENLDADGVAILNGDDDLLNTVSVPQKIIRCGRGENCDVRVTDVVSDGLDGVSCTVHTEKADYALRIPAPGAHMIYPAAIAVAVGELLGLSEDEIIRGVAGYCASGDRMRVEHLAGERIVLNDTYNASPQAMEAAVRILAKTDAVKRIAMLGDMAELGDAAERCHRKIGHLVGEEKIDVLFCTGENCRKYLLPEAEKNGCRTVRWYPCKEDAYADLIREFVPRSVVLLKASHFSGRFDLIADYLREYDF